MITGDAHEYTEREIDEAIEESFPASDPPANTVETGIVPRELPVPDAATPVVFDNPDRGRFETRVDGGTAFLTYERSPLGLTLLHTEVPERARGRGIGTALVKAAMASGRAEGLRVIAQCAFAKAHLRKQPR